MTRPFFLQITLTVIEGFFNGPAFVIQHGNRPRIDRDRQRGYKSVALLRFWITIIYDTESNTRIFIQAVALNT